MKKLLCTFFIVGSYTSFSQSYISLAPSLTNTAGTIADKSNIALEAGQQWECIFL